MTDRMNNTGDVITHEMLGPGEWVVLTVQSAGDNYGGRTIVLRRLLPGTDHLDWQSDERSLRIGGHFSRDYVLPYTAPIRSLTYTYRAAKEDLRLAAIDRDERIKADAIAKLTDEERSLLGIKPDGYWYVR